MLLLLLLLVQMRSIGRWRVNKVLISLILGLVKMVVVADLGLVMELHVLQMQMLRVLQ